jgi:hypothetical protein
MAAVGGAGRGGGVNAALAKAFAVRRRLGAQGRSWWGAGHLLAGAVHRCRVHRCRVRSDPTAAFSLCVAHAGRGAAEYACRGEARAPSVCTPAVAAMCCSRGVSLRGRRTSVRSSARARGTQTRKAHKRTHAPARAHAPTPPQDTNFAVQRVADAALAHPDELLSTALLRLLAAVVKHPVSTAPAAGRGAASAWLGRLGCWSAPGAARQSAWALKP